MSDRWLDPLKAKAEGQAWKTVGETNWDTVRPAACGTRPAKYPSACSF
jgi:hypothetical protein